MAETRTQNDLAARLRATWAAQGRDGFLLSPPDTADIETRSVTDEQTGVAFRFRWLPHREARGDVKELERRGILNPQRDESKLFRDPRDPQGRHCFLCVQNIAECHPLEVLVPLRLAGTDYYAGANFAWIEFDHFTVMAAEHRDQAYSRHVLDAMIDLHDQTGGAFRVLFNGDGAGATIPWHLHYQITTEQLPIEDLAANADSAYPTLVTRFTADAAGVEAAHELVAKWLGKDEEQHSVNILIAPGTPRPTVHIFPRDKRRARAAQKGLVGGFEVAGDFVMSAPAEREPFETSTAETARDILGQVRPEHAPA